MKNFEKKREAFMMELETRIRDARIIFWQGVKNHASRVIQYEETRQKANSMVIKHLGIEFTLSDKLIEQKTETEN